MDEWLSAFRAEMVALVGARSLTFMEFWPCGAPDYHVEKNQIEIGRWLVDVANNFPHRLLPRGGQGQTSFLPFEGHETRLLGACKMCSW